MSLFLHIFIYFASCQIMLWILKRCHRIILDTIVIAQHNLELLGTSPKDKDWITDESCQ